MGIVGSRANIIAFLSRDLAKLSLANQKVQKRAPPHQEKKFCSTLVANYYTIGDTLTRAYIRALEFPLRVRFRKFFLYPFIRESMFLSIVLYFHFLAGNPYPRYRRDEPTTLLCSSKQQAGHPPPSPISYYNTLCSKELHLLLTAPPPHHHS